MGDFLGVHTAGSCVLVDAEGFDSFPCFPSVCVPVNALSQQQFFVQDLAQNRSGTNVGHAIHECIKSSLVCLCKPGEAESPWSYALVMLVITLYFPQECLKTLFLPAQKNLKHSLPAFTEHLGFCRFIYSCQNIFSLLAINALGQILSKDTFFSN